MTHLPAPRAAAAQQRALILAAAALLAHASYAFAPLAAPRPRVALPERSTEAGGFMLFMGWGDDIKLKTAMVVSDAASAAGIRSITVEAAPFA